MIGPSNGVNSIFRVFRSEKVSPANKASVPAGSVSQKDALNLSPEAKILALAQQAVREAPEIRAEKVEALKAAIADGSYQVSSEQLADDLLQELEKF